MYSCCGGCCHLRRRRRKSMIRRLFRDINDDDWSWSRRRAATSVLNHLSEQQIQALIKHNNDDEDDDKEQSVQECFSVPLDQVQVGDDLVEPVVLLCQLLRWNDISVPGDLLSVPGVCSAPASCCNPFHYCRLCIQSYRLSVQDNVSSDKADQCLPEESFPLPPYQVQQESTYLKSQKAYSLSTIDTSNCSVRKGSVTWCKLAYWEECKRVGALQTITKPWVDIRCASKHAKDTTSGSESRVEGQQLHLNSLFNQNCVTSESTSKVRKKIGRGIVVSYEDDCVWLFNVSQIPIFVNSPTMETSLQEFTVHKILPGDTIKVFDFELSLLIQKRRDCARGPYDPYAVRVSFGKGWGSNYSRQDATNCPCWLELLLSPLNAKQKDGVDDHCDSTSGFR